MEKVKRHSTSHNVGEDNPRAELRGSDIHFIRQMLAGGMTQAEVALFYGVSRSTISHIKTGRRWSQIQVSSEEMEVSN
jgi:DNA-binding transcriptional regulator YiaG